MNTPGTTPPAPTLLVGPLLRYTDTTSATLWVETDRACLVTVDLTGGPVTRTPTWSVHGHHYALIVIRDLAPGTRYPYQVDLDATPVWPLPGATASVVRTVTDDDRFRLSFGSCRRTAPMDAEGLKQFGADALVALSVQLSGPDPSDWPDLLLMAGDQIYADEPSESLVERLRAAHPEDDEIRSEVHDFEEYTWLYHESWQVPAVRWLLSTVPTAMILDDHDLRDDWNSSWSWRQEVTVQPWWDDRVVGAFASYWVYQHLGNLAPDELDADPDVAAILGAPDDATRTTLLDDLARRADADAAAVRWSFARDVAHSRLVVVDSRAARSLDPDSRRMVDATEWSWFAEQCADPGDHLLIGSTLPFLMLPGLHHLEGWNEATANGAWGRAYASVAEHARQLVDLEHWAAFRGSFDAMTDVLTEVATAERAPASVLVLSGDVHCSYAAEAHLTASPGALTRVHQLVMSPFRNPLSRSIRVANELARTAPVRWLTRALARHAGVRDPAISWDVDRGPYFDNGVMTVELAGRHARVALDVAEVDGLEQRLVRRGYHRLAG